MRGEDGRTGKGVVGEGPAGEVGISWGNRNGGGHRNLGGYRLERVGGGKKGLGG